MYEDWLGRSMAEPFWSDGNFLVALIIGVYIFQNMLNCTLKIFACFICKFYSQKNTYLGGYVLMFLFASEICFKCIRKKIRWSNEKQTEGWI